MSLKETILQCQGAGDLLRARSPIDGQVIAKIGLHTAAEAAESTARAAAAYRKWRSVPAPVRGELGRRIGQAVREDKQRLADIIVREAGKTVSEAQGEIQEWIDLCDFAVGLSRQLYGLTLATERSQHRMMEQWHPLGPVLVISAFNFPVAVWAWNAMIALVCGNTVVWKPSEQTPLCALLCQELVERVAADFEPAPEHLVQTVLGGRDRGEQLARDPAYPLVSATGSVKMGREVAQIVAARLGRSLLELGGNNALIVTPSANLNLAVRAIAFSAVGTCGQRCTSLRRLIAHHAVIDLLLERLSAAYATLRVGDPRDPQVLVGPIISGDALRRMHVAIERARAEGGTLVCGADRVLLGVPEGGIYVRPAIVRVPRDASILQEETFAPVLWVHDYDTLDEAIDLQNNVPQGLSSAIFTESLREAERFLSPAGSDCGIANVNIGTSGAEIGGAFGGEKETGGGRESGSDAWRAYMRRVTNTINYGDGLPLAQGISFDV